MNLVRPTGTNGLYQEEDDLSHAHATVYVTGTQVEEVLKEQGEHGVEGKKIKPANFSIRQSCLIELHRK